MTDNGLPSIASSSQNGTINVPESGGEVAIAPVATPPRLRLSTLSHCAVELRRIYAAVKAGNLASSEASKRVWIIMQLSNLIVDSDLESKLSRLEQAKRMR